LKEDEMDKPFEVKPLTMRGVIAVCSLGHVGLITKDTKQEITYPDGNTGHAYVGLHLDGTPWSSRAPTTCGNVREWYDSGMCLCWWLQRHGTGVRRQADRCMADGHALRELAKKEGL
jgi:hypothetical protein